MSEPSPLTPVELRERAREIYEKKLASEQEPKREFTEQEQALKKEIKEQAKTPSPPHIQDAVSQQISEILSLDDHEQLSELIKLIYTKDVLFAVKVAHGLQSPLVLDAFHDLLASDQLYYKLVNQKRL